MVTDIQVLTQRTVSTDLNLASTVYATSFAILQGSDFQPGFRRTQGFREHMPGVPRLVSKKIK